MKSILRTVGCATVLLFVATAASAQATRTWVSGVGDDVNPCSRTAPCKTWAGAISKTAAGGEIDALDDGGFGSVTITKAMTIDGGGHLASILASGTVGITVNAGAADIVTLRRLQINGAGTTTGTYGVRVLTAKQVNIEDSEIFGFTGTPGIGVFIGPSAATYVQISNTRLENNDTGLQAGAFTTATVLSCAIVGNAIGVDASGSGTPPQILISNSNISLNGTGIQTNTAAVVRLSHNDIVAGPAPSLTWNIVGGVIQTYKDNRVMGTGSGTLTDVP
jgi:hypothetical protein